jgi:hypothetical protein
MRLSRLIPTLAAAAVCLAAATATAAVPPAWDAKVDPWVLSTAGAGPTEFLVFLKEQADLSAADVLPAKEVKGRYVFDALRATADRTQGPLLALLAARGVEHRPFWIANMIWVKGDLALVEELAGRDDVAHVYANPTVHQEPVEKDVMAFAPDAVEWNVTKIRAPELWTAGITGQGIVIDGGEVMS